MKLGKCFLYFTQHHTIIRAYKIWFCSFNNGQKVLFLYLATRNKYTQKGRHLQYEFGRKFAIYKAVTII